MAKRWITGFVAAAGALLALGASGVITSETSSTQRLEVEIPVSGGFGDVGETWYAKNNEGYTERHAFYISGDLTPSWVTNIFLRIGYPNSLGDLTTRDYLAAYPLSEPFLLTRVDASAGGAVGFAVRVSAEANTNEYERSFEYVVVDETIRYYDTFETKRTTTCRYLFFQGPGEPLTPKVKIGGAASLSADGVSAYSCELVMPDGALGEGTATWSVVQGGAFAVIDSASGLLTARNATFLDQTVKIQVTVKCGEEEYSAVKSVKIAASRIPDGMFSAASAKAMTGLYNAGGSVFGCITLKTTKRNKKGVFKISGYITTLDGKKHAVKSVSVDINAVGIDKDTMLMKIGGLVAKGIGTFDLSLTADSFYGAFSNGDFVESYKLGGRLGKGVFRLERGFALPVEGELQTDLMPFELGFGVFGTKWSFGKGAVVKMGKNPSTKEQVLIVNTSGGKTNRSSLKLKYTAKTGMFKGSFKAYYVSQQDDRKKLVKYTVNVSGVVVDGVGIGKAWCKKPVSEYFSVELE